ncbi:MAG: SCO family protein [Hyphomicrobiales bacterium]|nr:MAG: SCO family protein [Hyphomicrobiales bacterium]
MRLAAAVLVVLAIALPGVARADEPANAQRAISASEASIGQMLPNVEFTRSNGVRVRLADYLGKPLLVTLVYTSCVDVCPTLIESLLPAVAEARKSLGPDSFSVVTIGFDVAKDTPERMRTFAAVRGVNLANWHFLSTDQDNLDRLSQAVGFGIFARAGSWDHLAQVTLVDAGGRVRQQIYGAVFDPPLVVEPLKYLVLGRELPLNSLDRLIQRVKFFCTVYDATAGRYYFNYSLFLNIAIGILCFATVLVLLVREWRSGRSGARPT